VGAQPILVLTGKGEKTRQTAGMPKKTLVFETSPRPRATSSRIHDDAALAHLPRRGAGDHTVRSASWCRWRALRRHGAPFATRAYTR
jgi:hypothetical protein